MKKTQELRMDLRWKHSHVVGPGHPREFEAWSEVFFREMMAAGPSKLSPHQ